MCSRACGIDLVDSYVVTGGKDGSTYQTVARYSVRGEVRYLDNLQTGRYNHACSKFDDDAGHSVSYKQNFISVEISHYLSYLDIAGHWRKGYVKESSVFNGNI